VLLNVLIAYAIAAVVTFAMILASEMMSPSAVNPYLGQAVGGTSWTMVWIAFGSPAVLLVLTCLDWGLRLTRRQRLAGSAVSLLPGGIVLVSALITPEAGAGMTFALWLLLVGLAFGRVMLLPPST